MFWSLPNDLLADPQQLNSYSYARNNPIVASDPSGLLTAFFPGTWTSKNDIANSKEYTNFVNDFKSTSSQLGAGDKFWMPSQELKDNDASPQAVTQKLKDYLSTYQFEKGETFNVGGISHGGNGANIFSQLYDGKIDNLITVGTPVRSDYQPNYDNIGNHYNAYSNIDFVQISGGNNTSASEAIGRLMFGNMGARIGKNLNWGEFGIAGRKYDNAENINVTWQSGLNPIWSAHQDLSSTSVWSKINKMINNK